MAVVLQVEDSRAPLPLPPPLPEPPLPLPPLHLPLRQLAGVLPSTANVVELALLEAVLAFLVPLALN